MKLLNKINLKKLFIISFISINLFFYASILLVGGYPETNDILHIFKVTSLEGKLKFVNGYYPPGFSYYTLLMSNSLTILSFVIIYLGIQSSFLVYLVTDLIKVKLNKTEQFYFYSYFLIFHFIIILTIGFIHSDSIFILLLYNGIILFIIGYYLKNKFLIYFIGCLLIGLSIIFRHQGPIILFFLFLLFLYYEIISCNKKILLNYKKYLIITTSLTAPFFISYLHLFFIDAFSQSLTDAKLYYYLHGDKLGDWRDLKSVYQSDHYLNFNLANEEIERIISITLNHIKGILRIVYPFIFCFLLAYSVSKKKIILFSLTIFLTYLLVILPGYHAGYYPSLFICFIVILLNLRETIQSKLVTSLTLVFLIGHLIYLSNYHFKYVYEKYKVSSEINNKIVPILNKKGLGYSNIFSDDYNFYTTKLKGEVHKLCNWGGWFIKHPYLKDYYPRKVLNGEKNKYCNIKALITRDQKFADLYIINNKFDEHYKFDIYHLFIRK